MNAHRHSKCLRACFSLIAQASTIRSALPIGRTWPSKTFQQHQNMRCRRFITIIIRIRLPFQIQLMYAIILLKRPNIYTVVARSKWKSWNRRTSSSCCSLVKRLYRLLRRYRWSKRWNRLRRVKFLQGNLRMTVVRFTLLTLSNLWFSLSHPTSINRTLNLSSLTKSLTRLRLIGIGSYTLRISQAPKDRNYSTFIRHASASSSASSAVAFASPRIIAAASQRYSRMHRCQAAVSAGENPPKVQVYAPLLEEACDSKVLSRRRASRSRGRARCTSSLMFTEQVNHPSNWSHHTHQAQPRFWGLTKWTMHSNRRMFLQRVNQIKWVQRIIPGILRMPKTRVWSN